LGYTDIKTTAVYAKILDETVKDEMKKIKDLFYIKEGNSRAPL
jgi:hypothetical protein